MTSAARSLLFMSKCRNLLYNSIVQAQSGRARREEQHEQQDQARSACAAAACGGQGDRGDQGRSALEGGEEKGAQPPLCCHDSRLICSVNCCLWDGLIRRTSLDTRQPAAGRLQQAAPLLLDALALAAAAAAAAAEGVDRSNPCDLCCCCCRSAFGAAELCPVCPIQTALFQ
eukprot:COSAG01_NODE_1330_length_10699_cov_49.561604_8_plen_172_part_00